MPQRATKLTRQKAAGISVVDSWCVATPRTPPRAHTLPSVCSLLPALAPVRRCHESLARAAHTLRRRTPR
jgi:hypothetical protein